MTERLAREESGMALPLAIVMILLIGVMGAGLLTFVSSDVASMGQTNRGQQALQVADAGVEAAQQRLIADDRATLNHDGGSDDSPWSFDRGGMTLNMGNAGSATVTIQTTNPAPPTFRVISEGRSGDAKRRIEAFFRADQDVTFPRTYMSRTDLCLQGSLTLSEISFFALEDVLINNRVDLGSAPDSYYGSWAATTGVGPYPNSAGSYPNAFNLTARTTNLAGVAARGAVSSGSNLTQSRNTRVFSGATTGAITCPGLGTVNISQSLTSPQVVPDYYASNLSSAQKIAFPFQVSTGPQDKEQLNALRQRALALETSPGGNYYIDSIPGNGRDDAGRSNRPTSTPEDTQNWYSPSNYDTVRFYEFQSYHPNNVMRYANSAAEASCSSTNPPKGVIVVENGNFVYDGNNAFNGGIVVRAYTDSSGSSVTTQGTFTASGNPCLRGYANSGGTMSIGGNITLGTVPELGTITTFRGEMELVSWRELYE